MLLSPALVKYWDCIRFRFLLLLAFRYSTICISDPSKLTSSWERDSTACRCRYRWHAGILPRNAQNSLKMAQLADAPASTISLHLQVCGSHCNSPLGPPNGVFIAPLYLELSDTDILPMSTTCQQHVNIKFTHDIIQPKEERTLLSPSPDSPWDLPSSITVRSPKSWGRSAMYSVRSQISETPKQKSGCLSQMHDG